MAYYKVTWMAWVGESIIKAESEEEALKIAQTVTSDKIISENFWLDDAGPEPAGARKLNDDELKAMGIL